MIGLQAWVRRRPDLAAFALFAVVIVAYLTPAALGHGTPILDAYDHAIIYGRMAGRAAQIRSGDIPLWDPKYATGLSNIDTAPTTSVFQWQVWFMALLGDRAGYMVSLMLELAAGAYGTYLLCRRALHARWPVAVISGMTIAFSPFLGPAYAAIFLFAPFASFYLLALIRALDARGAREAARQGLIAAIPLVACLYTQEPRYLEFMVWGSVIFVIATAVAQRSRWRQVLARAATFAPVAALTLLLAGAPMIGPMLAAAATQQRLGAGQALPPWITAPPVEHLLNAVAGGAFPLSALILRDGVRFKLFGDYLTLHFEYISVLYYASLAMTLALWRRLRPVQRAVVATAVVTKLLVVGAVYVPGLMRFWTAAFKSGRFLEADLPHLFGVLTVAIALDLAWRFGRRLSLDPRVRDLVRLMCWGQATFAAAGIGVIAAIGIGGRAGAATFPVGGWRGPIIAAFVLDRFWWILATFAVAGVAAASFAVLLGREPGRPSRRLQCALAVALVALPVLASTAYMPLGRLPDRFSLRTPERVYASRLSVLDRVDVVDWQFVPGLAQSQLAFVETATDVESLNWVFPTLPPAQVTVEHHFLPRELFAWLRRMYRDDPGYRALAGNPNEDRFYFFPVDDNLFHLLGVTRIFSRVNALAAPFRLDGRFGRWYVFRDADAAPRAFMARRALRAPGDTSRTLDAIEALPRDAITRDVFVEGRAGTFAAGAARIRSYRANEVIVDVTSSGPGLLVLADTYDPAWVADVDGRRARVERADTLFRAVRVPAGRHRVRFEYRHPLLAVYLLVCAVAVLAWAVLLTALSRGRSRAR